MNKIDKYIENIRNELKEKEITNEIEIIKYIYLDLGKNFSFDAEFIPFGNSKTKQNIYKYHCHHINDLEKCMETNKIICKSLSYILQYILEKFDVNIKTVYDPRDKNKYPHVFNYIITKDGRKFCIDLQDDINNIQTHSFTSNFGLESIDKDILVIDRPEQEKIDKKLGYITEDNYYSDEYLYLLHTIVDGIDNLSEKAEFILENIDIISTKNMGYTDRQWHHRKILEEFFTKKEFDYIDNSGKIKMFDCYKDINGKRKYINCITVRNKEKTEIYIYNDNKSKYSKINIDNYVNSVINGLNIHAGNIQGLKSKIYIKKQEIKKENL